MKYPTEKIGKTIWIETRHLIDIDNINVQKSGSQKVRAIRSTNPMTAKRTMRAEEAHYRLNHLSNEAITQSVKANIFVDVNQLSGNEFSDCKML